VTVQQLLQQWEVMQQLVLLQLHAGMITNTAAQQQFECLASLLQLSHVTAAVGAALWGYVQNQVHAAGADHPARYPVG
jgi:hypothetical protein